MKVWQDFSGHVTFRVGDGRRNSFWNHKWCGEDTLRVSFPSLFGVSNQRELTVHQIRRVHEREVLWDITFRRNLQDWEIGEFQRLIELLYKQILLPCNQDS